MRRLIEDLEKADWDQDSWHKTVIDLFSDPQVLKARIKSHMMEWAPEERLAKLNGSHETSTHYKWLIHRDRDRRFTIWLHDYKYASQRRPGYAEVPHNHRYDLCSMVLSGGYDSITYDVTDYVVPVSKQTLRSGDILALSHEDVHSLEQIVEGTQTLFMEGPTKKNYSTAFPIDGEARTFIDFEGRWDNLLTRLGPL